MAADLYRSEKRVEKIKNNPLINIGGVYILPKEDVLGVFDLDATTTKTDTKRFLQSREKMGRSVLVGNDLPKSFVLTVKGRREVVYITTLSTSAIQGRWKRQSKHL